jgi:3-hydroxypropanoate dehydrogenase
MDAPRTTLDDAALDQLFREARSYNVWLDKPVGDDLLRQLYDVVKWAPTSANSSPARFVFVRTKEGKERLKLALAPGNVDKTMSAPVTVIVAFDLKFYEKMPRLFPHNPKMRELYANAPELVEVTARRNSSLQGGYLILAARALGLDCGPMSGFDNAKLDELFFNMGNCEGCDQEFFPQGHVKSNFLVNLGYADPASLFPRGPRLTFEEACTLL